MFSPGRLNGNRTPEMVVDGYCDDRVGISQLGARPRSAMRQQHIHMRTLTQYGDRPRLHPQQSRGRSNTATPQEFYSRLNLPFNIAEDEDSNDGRLSAAFNSKSSSGGLSRSLRIKANKLLKRSDDDYTKGSARKPLDWSEEFDPSPYESGAQTSPKLARSGKSSPEEDQTLRWNISEPFNFQHLTHTEHNQYHKIQETAEQDLENEFSAMRASQATRKELRGIRTHDIVRRDSDDDDMPLEISPTHVTHRSSSRRPSDTSPSLPPLITLESMFERPVSVAKKPILQRRRPEKTASPDSIANGPFPDSDSSQKTTESVLGNLQHESLDQSFAETRDLQAAGVRLESNDHVLPHAVTTSGDAAQILQPFPADTTTNNLFRVAEEDEHADPVQGANEMKAQSNATKSPPQSRKSLHDARNPLNAYQRNRWSTSKSTASLTTSSLPVRGAKMQPSFEEEAENHLPQTRLSQLFPVAIKDNEGCWEEIIDWCYDNEAEADCNFDFTRAGSPVPTRIPDRTNWNDSTALPASQKSCYDSDRHRRTSSVYSTSFVPLQTTSSEERPPTSAVSTTSSFDSVSEAVTPVLADGRSYISHFSCSDSRSQWSKHSGEAMPHIRNDLQRPHCTEDISSEYECSDIYDFGRVDSASLSTISARSSRSPISKSNSHESFWASRQSSNNHSHGSLPDLIPSKGIRDLSGSEPEQGSECPTNGPLVAEPHQIPSQHRRSHSSLVRDLAQKNLLSRMICGTLDDATNAQVPLPLHPALRQADATVVASPDPNYSSSSVSAVSAARLRSASSATSMATDPNLTVPHRASCTYNAPSSAELLITTGF